MAQEIDEKSTEVASGQESCEVCFEEKERTLEYPTEPLVTSPQDRAKKSISFSESSEVEDRAVAKDSLGLSGLSFKSLDPSKDFPANRYLPQHRLDFRDLKPRSRFVESNKRGVHRKLSRDLAKEAISVADKLYSQLKDGETVAAVPVADTFEGLSTNLLARLLFAESTGEVMKASSEGAQGLGQIVPGTGEEMVRKYLKGETWDPFNPKMNIRVTALYLSELLQTYRQEPRTALAAYNHGPTKVNRLLKETMFGGYKELEVLLPDGYSKNGDYNAYNNTQEYVRKVMAGPMGEPKTFKLRLN